MTGPNLARRTVRLWMLGRELTRIRKERGLTDADIKNQGVDPSAIWRWVNGGTHNPRRSTVETLLTILDVHGPERAELLDLAMHPDGVTWVRAYEGVLPEPYATYIGFEAEARLVHNFELVHIPGLLQTAAYTEALIRAVPGVTEEHVARQLEVRAQRRAVLAAPDPLQLHVIVDAAALRRQVGGPTVMRDQLRSLLDLRSNVTLQVVPFERGAHASGTGPFVIMEFRDPRAPSVAFAEYAGGLIFVGSDDHYDRIWESLASLALNPAQSTAYLASAVDEFE